MKRGAIAAKLVLAYMLAAAVVVGTAETWALFFHPQMDPKSFRASRPEPYRNSPYFSPEFIEESFRQPGNWIFTPTNLFIPQDFEGRYFNVRDGLRVTVG